MDGQNAECINKTNKRKKKKHSRKKKGRKGENERSKENVFWSKELKRLVLTFKNLTFKKVE